nr:MAG TPA: hypothetical protein [Caudoviricetes sp.]
MDAWPHKPPGAAAFPIRGTSLSVFILLDDSFA